MPSRAPMSRASLLIALTLVGASCSGTVADPTTRGDNPTPPGPGGGPGSGPTGGGGPGAAPVTAGLPPSARTGACKTIDPGPSPMRLLTRIEYGNTVADLLGDGARAVATDLPDDARPVRGYANDAIGRSASDLLVDKFSKAADTLATNAIGQLPTLLGGCDPARDGESACLTKFFDTFGKRIWRRPVTAVERQNLTSAFNDAKTKGFADGLSAVLQVMLIAPQFLYRYEQGTPVASTGYAQLNQWELASRLSYLLWNSMPDAALLTAAEQGKLGTNDEILAQARRMVDDNRHMPMVTNFAEQYLDLDQLDTLDKDTMELPKWSPELRGPLQTEADKLIEAVFSKSGDGKLSTLLTANYSYMNGPLASFYGVTGPTGADFQKVMLPPDRSSGILTQGGFLSVHATQDNGLTSLVFRGKFVRENLLCQPVPDPPPNAQDMNPPFTPTTTPREWSMLRMAQPLCGTCHAIMDPMGFGFENFDPIGHWRDTDRGKPVDASGTLLGSEVDGPFKGVPALGRKLASSKTVSDCVASQYFRFAVGREESPRDACSVELLKKSMIDTGGDLRALLLAYVQTDAFLFRSKGDAP
jgi:hypothetical protein